MSTRCRHVHVRPHCFIPTEACSCKLELAYFAGKISKNRLVCKNAVALAYYWSGRLLVMGSWLRGKHNFKSSFILQCEAGQFFFTWSHLLEHIVFKLFGFFFRFFCFWLFFVRLFVCFRFVFVSFCFHLQSGVSFSCPFARPGLISQSMLPRRVLWGTDYLVR